LSDNWLSLQIILVALGICGKRIEPYYGLSQRFPVSIPASAPQGLLKSRIEKAEMSDALCLTLNYFHNHGNMVRF
jgi:hypothetical protein